MNRAIAAVLFACCFAGWGSGAAAMDKGSETIVFEKGRMPQVTFKHHMHQEKLENECSACHDLFPMQAGAIRQMIADGKLKNQQVMNEKCVSCHKDRKKQGLAAGPTSCTACHVRP
jgi:hypothetical protein